MAGKFNIRFPSKLIENILLRISIFGILSLVLIQFFLSNEFIRTVVGSSNNKNVIAIEESTIYQPSGWIEMEIRDYQRYKKINILKNGEEIKEPLIVHDVVKIEILDGDVIEVDATQYDEAIEIVIAETSNNIKIPHKGQEFESS